MTAGAPVMDCPEQPTLPFDPVPWEPSAPTPIETMATVATIPGPDVIVDGRYRIQRRVGAAVIAGGIATHRGPRVLRLTRRVPRRLGSHPRSPCECGVRRRQQPKDRPRGRRSGRPRRRPSADAVPSAAKEQRARVQVSTARRDRRSTGTGTSNAACVRSPVPRARPPHVLPAGPGHRVAGALPGSRHGGSAVGVTVGARLCLTVRTARAPTRPPPEAP
jgi:hypothetical protein